MFKNTSSSNEGFELVDHLTIKLEVTSQSTVKDIKQEAVDKLSKIGSRQINPDNLVMLQTKYGETVNVFEDDTLIGDVGRAACLIETKMGEIEDSKLERCTELNFSACQTGKRGKIEK